MIFRRNILDLLVERNIDILVLKVREERHSSGAVVTVTI
jgi:hypothetical protein